MQYLPLFLKVHGQPCLVVGGGDVAARKAALLHRAGAQVKVVALEVHEQLQVLANEAMISVRQGPFSEVDLKGARLVIAATDDEPLNEQVYQLAKRRGILVNVADCPQRCDFILPSIVD